MKICADIGGSFINLALIGDDLSVRRRAAYATPTLDWTAFVAVFADFIQKEAQGLSPDTTVCISAAGLVAPDRGVLTSANIPCANGRVLADDLAAALGRPVFVVNDADAFALAESALGAARGHSRVFGLILGTGVGGALVEDGRIVVGPKGVAGEWGHGPLITASPRAPGANPVFACGCGRTGCLDTVASARGLERLHHFLHGTRMTSRAITAAFDAGEADALATVDYYCDLLAGPLAMLLNTFPATIVPVGGGLANAASLLALLDERVRRGMLAPPSTPILIRAALGGDAGLLGARLAVGAEPVRLAVSA